MGENNRLSNLVAEEEEQERSLLVPLGPFLKTFKIKGENCLLP